MKKLIVSLVTVLAVASAVAVTTYAVFTAEDTIEGNTISTATVVIDAHGETTTDSTLAKPIDNTDPLVPGEWTEWYRGIVHNQSNVDVELYMYVNNVSGTACNKTNLEVRTGHATPNNSTAERQYEIYNGSLSGITGPGNRKVITGYVLDPLQPNRSAVLQQRAQLDSSANNNHQGAGCTWDEVFVAETVTP